MKTNTVECCGQQRTSKFCPECGAKLETPEAKVRSHLQGRVDSINNEKRESETKAERLSSAAALVETFDALVSERDALVAEFRVGKSDQ